MEADRKHLAFNIIRILVGRSKLLSRALLERYERTLMEKICGGWRGGRRTSPANIIILLLRMRENWLSNRGFKGREEIVDHCCDAWRELESQP